MARTDQTDTAPARKGAFIAEFVSFCQVSGGLLRSWRRSVAGDARAAAPVAPPTPRARTTVLPGTILAPAGER